MPLSVPLRFVAEETPVRRGEPVTVGLPSPRGAVADDRCFRLVAPDGTEQLLQTQVLDRWPDGSVRWCLFDFLATVDGANDGYRIELGVRPRPADPARAGTSGEVIVRRLASGGSFAFHEAGSDQFRFVHIGPVEPGPVRERTHFRADPVRGLEVFGFVDTFAELATSRVTLVVRNPSPADHPGGNWDLGNGGSAFLRDFTIRLGFDDPNVNGICRVSLAPGTPPTVAEQPVTLFQASSGGPAWNSSNHVNYEPAVRLPFRGFKLSAGRSVADGGRATPALTLEAGSRFLGVAVPRFWENFPKSVRADATGLSLSLFPGELPDLYELQGGEQKTHTFAVAFGRDTVTDEPMVWCRSPLLCHADPEWYAASGAVPCLTPKAADPNAEYLKLVDQAIDGPDTFFRKREVIDEYGWRHYGDIYGDHEAVKHTGPTPLISHYNNQYDCVAGFAEQFLRSGDPRWWELMISCADHTCDIDVYHTDGDKAAYNRGLFWHTYHYADADTGTHRSYPRSLRRGPQGSLTEKMDKLGETAAKLQKAYAVGGGPAASHNYNYGLMVAYFLTGNPLYRDTSVDLAQFVIDMEDPTRTPFRWLSREFTGLATESGGGGYHGPGRAAGNSILALLVGHRLTGDRKYLDKAEQLIRRVVHPAQDLDRLDLLNAELRWFYTMTLQALGTYLDYKIELGELDRMYAYARLTLLHYARWMADHERPILDTPERLQYPTETWAAQDMRKCEVFQFAAKHAAGGEKARFLERAEWFFRYVERTLPTFPTKSLCRPVVLMLRYGWSHAWWQRHPDASAPEPAVAVTAADFGGWRMFVPQKAIAVRRAKRIVVAGAIAAAAMVVAAAAWWMTR
jgi:hypothetical protein